MSAPQPDDADGAPPGRLVRPYAITGGRTRPADDVPVETLVTSTVTGRGALATLVGEQHAIVALCANPIAVVELAARLGVPFGVARVLVGDLVADGLVELHRPARDEAPRDVQLLERVLHGLRAL